MPEHRQCAGAPYLQVTRVLQCHANHKRALHKGRNRSLFLAQLRKRLFALPHDRHQLRDSRAWLKLLLEAHGHGALQHVIITIVTDAE